MLGFVGRNKTAFTLSLVALAMIGIIATLSGCNFDDVFTVKVPTPVQAKLGVPQSVPLSQASGLLGQYEDAIKREQAEREAALAKWQADARRRLSSLADEITLEASIREADAEQWRADVDRTTAALNERVASAKQNRDWFAGLVNSGLGTLRESGFAAAVPGGLLLTSGLAFLGGLFTRTPGTQALVDAGYDQARRDLIEDIRKLGRGDVADALTNRA